MNVADSEELAGVFEANGYKEADSPEKADFVLVNTCVVRQNPEDKAVWYIKTLKGFKKKNKNMQIGVCGCLVAEPDRDVKKMFPHVDLFIGPHEPEKLAYFLSSNKSAPLHEMERATLQTRALKKTGEVGEAGKARGGLTAWITIMHGCDNFCSYCIVPYVRGREKSRTPEQILEEIKIIDTNRFKEIYLLGQNVNSYKYGFADLLKKVDELGLVSRIRFMTNHPKDMTDNIIEAVATLPHVCEFIHLPIQHGDDEILKIMNRKYTYADYKKLTDKIKAKIPGVAITSDIIIGYPGETEAQFQNSIKAIEEIGFDAVNTTCYSPRPSTQSAKLKDDVPQNVKAKRLQEIMRVVNKVVLINNKKLVGTTQEVLVDSKHKNQWNGRTRGNKIAKFISNEQDLIGKLVNIKIKSAKSWLLEGSLEK